MKRLLFAVLLLSLSVAAQGVEPSFSAAGVTSYTSCPGFNDLPWSSVNALDFRCWYTGGFSCLGPPGFLPFGGGSWTSMHSYPQMTVWLDNDVWGSDFRDGNGVNDGDPTGGSDLPNIYYYSGHGTCQNPPVASDPDTIEVCSSNGGATSTDIGLSSVWGSRSNGGHLQFLFLDASCPMDLISLERNWFWAFDGLHVATGHSGTANGDTLDSPWRGAQFAAYTSGAQLLVPHLSVGDAWMFTGLIDVQPGVCAVAMAQGPTVEDAIDRRQNERVTDGRVDPDPTIPAWRWVCN
jgi:hypothetical protein